MVQNIFVGKIKKAPLTDFKWIYNELNSQWWSLLSCLSLRDSILPGINVKILHQRGAAGMRGLTRAGRILQSWRRRLRCGNHQRSLGSSCRWGRSSWSWWRTRSPEVYQPVWTSRHQGRTVWWMDRSLSLRWKDASCRSSWAACEILQRSIKKQKIPITTLFTHLKFFKCTDNWVKMLIGVLSVIIIRVLSKSVLTDLCNRKKRMKGEAVWCRV